MTTLQITAKVILRATSEQFQPAGVTFRAGLAIESHWMQLVLVLTVQATNMCGWGITLLPPFIEFCHSVIYLIFQGLTKDQPKQ